MELIFLLVYSVGLQWEIIEAWLLAMEHKTFYLNISVTVSYDLFSLCDAPLNNQWFKTSWTIELDTIFNFWNIDFFYILLKYVVAINYLSSRNLADYTKPKIKPHSNKSVNFFNKYSKSHGVSSFLSRSVIYWNLKLFT